MKYGVSRLTCRQQLWSREYLFWFIRLWMAISMLMMASPASVGSLKRGFHYVVTGVSPGFSSGVGGQVLFLLIGPMGSCGFFTSFFFSEWRDCPNFTQWYIGGGLKIFPLAHRLSVQWVRFDGNNHMTAVPYLKGCPWRLPSAKGIYNTDVCSWGFYFAFTFFTVNVSSFLAFCGYFLWSYVELGSCMIFLLSYCTTSTRREWICGFCSWCL